MKAGYSIGRRMIGKDNRGFSLVELIIAVAIAGIVGASVFGFMQVGAKTFSYNSSDVNLQSESQLAFNQMQDLIIDTAVGVQYYAKNGTSLTEVGSDSEIASTDDKLLRLNNMDKVYDIWWDRDAQNLIYNEYNANYDSSTGTVTPITPAVVDDSNGLMSEYITDFSVDLSRLVSSRVVRIDLTYEKGGRVLATSHNITLRNQVVSGNKVEERLKDAYSVSTNAVIDSIKGKDVIYAEPGDNVDLKTVYDEGATGLTGYHVYDTAGDEIVAESNSLRYGFASGSTHETGYTTIGYGNGLLHVSNSETAGEFLVLVYCQSDTSKTKVVKVRVVRDQSLSIEFSKGTGYNDEVVVAGVTGDARYEDDLNVGETFNLTATPDISWTSTKVTAGGETLCSSDQTKLDTIESNIRSQIKFKGMTGYPTIFKETGSLNSGVSPCEFKMAPAFDFSGDTEKEYYQETISARAVCGYSESKSIDVHADWSGSAYKEKNNYDIKRSSSNIKRGEWQVTHMLSDPSNPGSNKSVLGTNQFTCKKGNTGDFWTNHIELIEIKVTEHPGDRVMDPSEYMRNTSEGANWTFKCPLSWDPNKQYTYEFTSHIAHTAPGSHEHNASYLLPHTSENGHVYSKADYEYTSNTLTFTFDRLRLHYTARSNYNNVSITEFTPSDMPDEKEAVEKNVKSSYATYYIRKFGAAPNNTDGMNDKINLKLQWNDSFNKDNGSNMIHYMFEGNPPEWNFYELGYGSDGKVSLTPYTSTSLVSRENNVGFATNKPNNTILQTYVDKDLSGIQLKAWKDNFTRGIPSRLRIVPVYSYTADDGGSRFKSEISDNYVDCVFWNIRVPYKTLAGKVYKATNIGKSYEECYFPGPEDPDFPGATSNELRWNYAGFDKSAKYNDKTDNKSYWDYYHLYYTLTKNDNIDGSAEWKLNLRYHDQNGSGVSIATYKYNNAVRQWEFVAE